MGVMITVRQGVTRRNWPLLFLLVLVARGGGVVSGLASAPPAPKDLLIVGCGTLGALAGAAWRTEFPNALVVGETMTDTRHTYLAAAGIVPSLRDNRAQLLASRSSGRFPYVLFCAAPRASGDRYPDEVRDALRECWLGETSPEIAGSNFVFTSSGGVFAEDNGGVVTEESAVSDTERARKLITAEKAVLAEGGSVVRLAGLYTATRGAHSYWLTQDEVGSNEDSIVNLLHYEDAAGVSIAALLRGATGDAGERVYLACDDEPLSRSEICNAALASTMYANAKGPVFKGTGGGMGKVYDTSTTRRRLGWQPKYPSFAKFMATT
jgi:hypothetical protein